MRQALNQPIDHGRSINMYALRGLCGILAIGCFTGQIIKTCLAIRLQAKLFTGVSLNVCIIINVVCSNAI